MDTRDILRRFASGDLPRDETLAMLRASAPADDLHDPAPDPTGSTAPTGVLEPIAVIGASARFPGAADLDAFRRLVREGREAVGEVPPDRWPTARWYDSDPSVPGRSLSRWGGMLDDAAGFDAELFRMTPREAALTDPQARLFLQECWRAVENAGYAPSALAGTRCGVYAGVMLNDYAHRVERSSPHHRLPQVMQGNSQSILAARVAYLLDLAGPVAAVDTACSSSLVALHQACQALWLGEADMMLAGGVTVYSTELPYVYMSKAGMLSPTGRCRPFDANADGFVPGEGSAVVLLKTLSRAEADGDPVQLVVRASGINHDGATNGLTAPSRRAQATLIAGTHQRFGIDPATIDYVECHGTGTPLGDPIEVSALNDAFDGAGLAAGSVPIGSVKGNVGHTSAAAGLAGLFKAMEVLASGRIPASLHYGRPNPRVPFGQGPFRVAAEPVALMRREGRPWRAAVSSFGLSGTNAHVVLEEPPAPAAGPTAASDVPALFVLSARDHTLLRAQAAELSGWLDGPGAGHELRDVARTLALGRDHQAVRLAVVAESPGQLRDALDAFTAGDPSPAWVASATPGADTASASGVRGASGDASDDRVHAAQAPLLDRLTTRAAPAGTGGRDDLLALGRLYTQAHDVAWETVFAPGHGHRIALPGSVLATARYWVDEGDGENGASAPPAALEGTGTPLPERREPAARTGVRSEVRVPVPELPGISLYVPRPRSAPAPVPDGGGPRSDHTLVVVGDDGGLAAALAPVWPGEVRTADGADAVALAADPSAYPPREPVTVLVALDADDGARPWWQPLFGPVREVLTGLWRRPVHVVAVSADRATATAAGGFVQTLAHENPRFSGRALLVDRVDGAAADLLVAECATSSPEAGRIVELRGGRRHSRLLARADVPAAAGSLRRGAVHLITGGLGGVGLLTARRLIERFDARVVLCGRRPAAELGEADREALDALGSAARYASVDVTDAAAVHALVADVLATEGALHGVFHAAGLLRDGYLVRKRPGDADTVIAAKADGVRALDEATSGLRLDAFVLFSSLSGLVGNLGQSDYAAGNGFLDGFAQERADAVRRGERHGRTLSVAWPLWRDGGMNVPDAVLAAMRESTGAEPLPGQVGLDTLDVLLSLPDGPPVVGVFHGERAKWEATLRDFSVLDPEPAPALGLRTGTGTPASAGPAAAEAGADRAAGQAPPGHGTEAGTGLAATPLSSFVSAVRRAVAEVTGMAESAVAMDAPLETLGFDSLTLRTLAAEITRSCAPLNPAEIFSALSLTALADLLASRAEASPAARSAARPAEQPPTTPTLAPATAPSPSPSPEPGPRAPAADTLRIGRAPTAVPLAVVGMSGRYPGAPDLDAFLGNLRAGRDTAGTLPAGRWSGAATAQEPTAVRGHFLTDVDRFDPEFFGLSPYESQLVDPQERLFLETAWQALEDAGALGERLDALCDDTGEPRSVGVFVGITSSDYQKLGVETWADGNRSVPAGHYWSVANRVSYLLDLRGPSQPVDTACSSSLTALHLAAQAIERGECAAAVVGGVNLYLHPSRMMLLKEFGFLSPDGRCRSFGEGGTGFGPGEGVGALVVKPLERALADGDQVYAVVRGTATAHSGRTHGYTAPSPAAQARVIRRALSRAGVEPGSIGLVEAHGTGTELGDPIEVAALTEVFGDRAGRPHGAPPIALGSVKSQIGHGESVAGLAALTKTVWQLRHRELLPTLHADAVNPALDLARTPFVLTTGHAPWPAASPVGGARTAEQGDAAAGGTPRRAGVSSFGAGGVNAHAVLEEYDASAHPDPRPTAAPREPSAGPELILLRAPSTEHLGAYAGRLADWLTDASGPGPSTDLADLAYTLRSGRAEQPCRLACTARDTAELARTLAAVARAAEDGGSVPGVHLNDLRVHTADAESFPDDEALRAYVATLWGSGGRDRVGRLWTRGLTVRWAELEARTGRIVPLPPTVFLRRRIWVAAGEPAGFPEPGTRAAAAAEVAGPAAPDVHLSAKTPPRVAEAPVTAPSVEPEPVAASARSRTTGPTAAEDGRGGGGGDGQVLARLTELVLDRLPGQGRRLDPKRSLVACGMDSVNLMSLRYAAEDRFGVELPLDLLGGDAPITAIADHIGAAGGGPPGAPRPNTGRPSARDLDHS